MPNSNNIDYPTEATVGNQCLRRFERQSRELVRQEPSFADLHRRILEVA